MAASIKYLKYLHPLANRWNKIANLHVSVNRPVQTITTSIRNLQNNLCYQAVKQFQYRQLDPEKNNAGKLFNTSNINVLKTFQNNFFFGNTENQPKDKKRVPKLILLQNPIKWLMIKIDFSVLRNVWDPTFEEKDFKFGTKQAISRVTQVISDGQYSELNGLLTKAARFSLLRELDRNWSNRQRSLLALKREDIQISSPRKVYFIRIADKKYCDVDMAFLALKWVPINSVNVLLFSEIFARFHREYTPNCIPEWTIAYFKITRFEVLKR